MRKSVAVIVNVIVLVSAAVIVNGCKSAAPVIEEGDGCQSPLGFIPEGHSKNGYLQSIALGGSNCEQGVLTCTNGQWSGAYINPSCTKQR